MRHSSSFKVRGGRSVFLRRVVLRSAPSGGLPADRGPRGPGAAGGPRVELQRAEAGVAALQGLPAPRGRRTRRGSGAFLLERGHRPGRRPPGKQLRQRKTSWAFDQIRGWRRRGAARTRFHFRARRRRWSPRRDAQPLAGHLDVVLHEGQARRAATQATASTLPAPRRKPRARSVPRSAGSRPRQHAAEDAGGHRARTATATTMKVAKPAATARQAGRGVEEPARTSGPRRDCPRTGRPALRAISAPQLASLARGTGPGAEDTPQRHQGEDDQVRVM